MFLAVGQEVTKKTNRFKLFFRKDRCKPLLYDGLKKDGYLYSRFGVNRFYASWGSKRRWTNCGL